MFVSNIPPRLFNKKQALLLLSRIFGQNKRETRDNFFNCVDIYFCSPNLIALVTK